MRIRTDRSNILLAHAAQEQLYVSRIVETPDVILDIHSRSQNQGHGRTPYDSANILTTDQINNYRKGYFVDRMG
ncbi:hypothetical protein H8D36_01525 [archaeon]|nr:hypothetical protein [archaeon]MBL7057173.1 hypothetical protein [Candidatus Woesearchaeota archaeon]